MGAMLGYLSIQTRVCSIKDTTCIFHLFLPVSTVKVSLKLVIRNLKMLVWRNCSLIFSSAKDQVIGEHEEFNVHFMCNTVL